MLFSALLEEPPVRLPESLHVRRILEHERVAGHGLQFVRLRVPNPGPHLALLTDAGVLRERAQVEMLGTRDIQGEKMAVLCKSTGGIYEVEARLRELHGKALGVIILWLGWFGFNGGSQLAMGSAADAVAIANIRLLQEQGLVDRVKNDIGPYLQERWAKLGEHPLVGETRMVGLMGALELVADKETLERFPEKRGAGTICRDLFVENGLVLRAVGDTMVCAPPLVLREEEADELVATAWTCLDLTAKALGS